jgi:hypothetical protein
MIDFQREHEWETVTLINSIGQNMASFPIGKGIRQFQWQAKKINPGNYTLIFRGEKGVYAHRITVL